MAMTCMDSHVVKMAMDSLFHLKMYGKDEHHLCLLDLLDLLGLSLWGIE